MSKRAPSTAQLLVIAGFALSCFGILLFLWVTFGGPTPFKAKPYEVKIPFNEATQLAEQSDVRISGVSVGKVQGIALAPNGKQALATIDIDDKLRAAARVDPGDPPHQDAARRDLRRTHPRQPQRSQAGRRRHPADGERRPVGPARRDLPHLRSAKTRAAFQTWMQEASVAIEGHGQALSNALGEFEPTFTEFDKLFRVLDTQRVAVGQLFRNGAISLEALRGREGQLASLIRNSNTVFPPPPGGTATSKRSSAPSRPSSTSRGLTLDRLKSFALNADPAVRQLIPAAEQLSPTLIAFSTSRPAGEGLLRRPRNGDRTRPRPASPPRASSSATSSRRCCARSIPSCATSTRSSPASASTSTR